MKFKKRLLAIVCGLLSILCMMTLKVYASSTHEENNMQCYLQWQSQGPYVYTNDKLQRDYFAHVKYLKYSGGTGRGMYFIVGTEQADAKKKNKKALINGVGYTTRIQPTYWLSDQNNNCKVYYKTGQLSFGTGL